MLKLKRWVVMAFAVFACASGVMAQGQDAPGTQGQDAHATAPDTAAGRMLGRVLKMFGGDAEAIGEADLAESFRAAVPLEKLRQVTGQIRASEGSLKLVGIEEGAQERRLVADVVGSKKGTALKVRLALDAAGKIEGLLIVPGVDARVPELKSWEDLKERMGKAAEKAALNVLEIEPLPAEAAQTHGPFLPDQRDENQGTRFQFPREHALVQLHPDEPLAIGSTFKLWVLGALANLVFQDRANWDEPLSIRDAMKSLPSGVMQNKADGTEFSIREFAEKMISISDNTATDHLIRRIGRDRCEGFMMHCCQTRRSIELNLPFLTTRDLFVLKLTPGNDLPERYIKADTGARRAMVAEGGEVARGTPQLMLAAAWKAPRYIDKLEWFASADDLAVTMGELDRLAREQGAQSVREILAINPGIPIDKKVWAYAGYKGGSEPGVLCFVWLLERKDGRRYVLAMIFNDTKKAIDEPLGIGLAMRAVEFLGKWDVK